MVTIAVLSLSIRCVLIINNFDAFLRDNKKNTALQ